MNNLTQTQINAKEAFLNKQQEQMLALYEKADISERKAIIKQINGFLSVVSKEEKLFWLKFRRKLETLNEKPILFPLGPVFMTVGAREALSASGQLPNEFLAKHQIGNWGIISEDDWKENELSLAENFRLFSVYKTLQDVKLWIITEADRSSTTILLPEEY